MGIQPCGVKMIRRCERAISESGAEAYVLRVNGHGGYDFLFVTDDHRHGTWDTKSGEITWWPDDGEFQCWSSCRWLFGPDAVDRSLWGLVDVDGRWRAVEWGKGRPLPVHSRTS